MSILISVVMTTLWQHCPHNLKKKQKKNTFFIMTFLQPLFGRQLLLEILKYVRITKLIYLETKKKPCKTFSQGKVILYALFRHGRKYLWKKVTVTALCKEGVRETFLFQSLMKPDVGKGKRNHSPPVLHALLGKARN